MLSEKKGVFLRGEEKAPEKKKKKKEIKRKNSDARARLWTVLVMIAELLCAVRSQSSGP